MLNEEKERDTNVVVEMRDRVDTYPADPRPLTVDVKFVRSAKPTPLLNEEKERDTKLVVEIKEDVKDAVERYPIEPSPVTVERS